MDIIAIFINIISGIASSYSYDWLKGNFKKIDTNQAGQMVENVLKYNNISLSDNEKKYLIEKVKSKINFDAELKVKFNVIFHDLFLDNRSNWFTGYSKISNSNSTIGKGFYEIENLSDTGTINFIAVNIDFSKDFYIECIVRLIKGSLNYGFGFTWGGNEDNLKNNQFLISGNGAFNAYFRNGDYSDTYSTWIFNSNILAGYNQENILSLEKKGSNIEYYINGEFIYRTNKPLIYGNRVGICTFFDTHVIIKSVKVAGI